MLTNDQRKKIEVICWKNQEKHTDEESTINMVFTATIFIGGNFDGFFETGFAPESVAECYEAIGHKMAAYTVRLAYRVIRSNPSDPALKLLGNAMSLMEESIDTLLGEYVDNLIAPDSQR